MEKADSADGRSTDKELVSLLDGHFELLDQTPLGLDSIFRIEDEKEKYESTLMFVFIEYQASLYHNQNVFMLETDDSKIAKFFFESHSSQSGVFAIRMTKNAYTYELSAFLQALKSAIDFIATACSLYIPGAKFDSISTLMKMARNRKVQNPILNVVARNIEWLESVRSYRHHLVHRRTLCVNGGFEKRTVNGLSSECQFPIAIPQVISSNVLDTRKSRMMEDAEFDCVETKIMQGDTVVDYSVEYLPRSGYIEISVFMANNLDCFEKFFKEILRTLGELNFRKL